MQCNLRRITITQDRTFTHTSPYKSQSHLKSTQSISSSSSFLNSIRHHIAGGLHLLPEASDQRKSPAVAHPSPEKQQQQQSHKNNNLYRRRTDSSNSNSNSNSKSKSNSNSSSSIAYIFHLDSDLHLPFSKRTTFTLLLLAAMALLFFVIFLFVTLDSHYVISDATTSQGVEVSYGSVIKLMHEKTKYRLHSHSVPYGSGSGQQSVTCFPRVDDANSYWIVRPLPETPARQGGGIETGTVIRLQHMRTRKWLHSHLHASPISGNLEVSCFGNDGNSDTGDHWRLEIEGSGKTWKQDQKIRLHHVETGGYLHSHDKKYNGVAGGQQEVCGVKEKRGTNIWLATEGIFFRTTEKK